MEELTPRLVSPLYVHCVCKKLNTALLHIYDLRVLCTGLHVPLCDTDTTIFGHHHALTATQLLQYLMTAMFTGAVQVTAVRADIPITCATMQQIRGEKRRVKRVGNSLARGAAMSARFGGFWHRVLLVRCLQRGRRCSSTLLYFPGNVLASEEAAATSEEAVAASDKAIATSDTDGEPSTPAVEKKIRKRSLCLPTVFLPPELRSALELVLSSKTSSI